MTPKNFVVILTIFAGMMLAGCAFNPPNGETDLLSDTGWLLTELGGSPIASSSAMTLNFSDNGKVSGSDGCNQYWST
ncbi:MAG: META domain-containing protein, partial [Candidatus Electrothrix sp. AR5]|nr:META domain-containing protein [Candidatus Electrothrix sp. AR5]